MNTLGIGRISVRPRPPGEPSDHVDVAMGECGSEERWCLIKAYGGRAGWRRRVEKRG